MKMHITLRLDDLDWCEAPIENTIRVDVPDDITPDPLRRAEWIVGHLAAAGSAACYAVGVLLKDTPGEVFERFDPPTIQTYAPSERVFREQYAFMLQQMDMHAYTRHNPISDAEAMKIIKAIHKELSPKKKKGKHK